MTDIIEVTDPIADLETKIITSRNAIAQIDADVAAVPVALISKNAPETRVLLAQKTADRAALSAQIELASYQLEQAREAEAAAI